MNETIVYKEKVLSRIYLMQYITRFNNQAMSDRQNIAEHSYGVSMLCVLIGNEVTERFRKTGTPVFLNVNKAVVMGLVHDYDETISTDIPLPLKQKLGKDVMFRIQEIVDLESDRDFKDMGLDLKKNKEEKENLTLEYQLVKVCDYLELLFWVYNNKESLGADYDVVVKNCKELMRTFEIHKHSSTVKQVLEAPDFQFKFQ